MVIWDALALAFKFTKSNTPPCMFSHFLNCTNGAKLHNASHINICQICCKLPISLKFSIGDRTNLLNLKICFMWYLAPDLADVINLKISQKDNCLERTITPFRKGLWKLCNDLFQPLFVKIIFSVKQYKNPFLWQLLIQQSLQSTETRYKFNLFAIALKIDLGSRVIPSTVSCNSC